MGLHSRRKDKVLIMSDDSRSADYYQAHKDDEAEWGAPVKAPASGSRRLASMISARFAPDEAESIRHAAAAEGDSVSQFIRRAALARAGHGPVNVSWVISGTVTGTASTIGAARHGIRSGLDAELGGELMPLAARRA